MEAEAEFEAPTWYQIYSLLLSQAEKIRQSGFKPDIIVGVTRGGWVPARVLADLLEIPLLATVGIEFYVGVAETRSEPVLSQRVSADVQAKKRCWLMMLPTRIEACSSPKNPFGNEV